MTLIRQKERSSFCRKKSWWKAWVGIEGMMFARRERDISEATSLFKVDEGTCKNMTECYLVHRRLWWGLKG